MAIDFPASPTVGQVFIFGTTTYIWDGTKWTSSAANSPFSLGNASTPSITFIGDTNTGIYSPGADQVSVTTGGTERLRVDAAGQIEAVSLGTAAAPVYTFTTDSNTGIYSPGADQLSITTGGTERVTVGSTGDVTFTGNITINAQNDIRLADSDSSNWLAFQAPASVTSNVTWTLPATDGTANQVLKTDGAGTLSWVTTSSNSITQGNTTAEVIDTGSDGRFVVTTEGTERLRVDSSGNLTINSQGDLRFGDADNSNWVAFQAPATVASNVTWTLPAADGTASQVLGTNGSGVLSFLTAGASLNVAAKSTNYTAVAADKSYLFTCTGSWTLSLTSAATLGNGWYIFLNNPGTGQITVDPDGTELIGGATTAVLNPGDLWLIACDGSNFVLNRLAGNNYEIFNSSGTFTVPAGVERIYVEAWGGGGGGGKGDSAGIASAGGGSGMYAAGWINVSPAQSITATIGAGGAGGTTTNSSGGNGGLTKFGVDFNANGGRGSIASALFAASSMTAEGGDISGSADIRIKGQPGVAMLLNSFQNAWTSLGANAPAGGTGGTASHLSGVNGLVAAPVGPGGGGYGGCDSAPNRNGGSGAAGRIIVHWI